MTKRCFAFLRLIAAMSIAALVACDSAPTYSGIETTNGNVTVAAASIRGSAPAHATVLLYASDYVPLLDSGEARATVADDTGRFAFDSVGAGSWALQVNSGEASARIDNITTAPAENSMAHLEYSLGAPGAITGSVAGVGSEPVLVYLAGTSFYTLLNADGSYRFDTVPPGEYTVSVSVLADASMSIKPSIVSHSTEQAVIVKAGQETHVEDMSVDEGS